MTAADPNRLVAALARDAIDRGDAAGALDQLHRMLRGGDQHPLAIMATLQSHYLRMLKPAQARDAFHSAAA